MRAIGLFLLFSLSTLCVAELKLSEVFYDTPGTDSVEEWIELYNTGCDTIDLSNYSLSDNYQSFNLSGTLQPGSYFIVAKSSWGFASLYGHYPNQSGMTLSLGNSGDYVALYLGSSLVDFVAWEGEEAGWNSSARYVSLYRHTISDYLTPSDWLTSSSVSPGYGNLRQTCNGDNTNPGSDDDGLYDGSYYDEVLSLSGSSLKAALQNLLENDHIRLSYSEVWEALQDTDEDPNNSNNVILLYTGRSHDKDDRVGQSGYDNDSWNREHVWPNSMGFPSSGQYGYTDLHNLRPTDQTVNGARANKDFDAGGSQNSEAPGNYSDSDSWEPRDEVKGDVARMIFYMDVRYDGSDGNMDDLYLVDDTSSASGYSFFGVLCTLYSWHHEDPVDTNELTRNDRVQSWQGNRNPFIDHPEWVEELYSSRCN